VFYLVITGVIRHRLRLVECRIDGLGDSTWRNKAMPSDCGEPTL